VIDLSNGKVRIRVVVDNGVVLENLDLLGDARRGKEILVPIEFDGRDDGYGLEEVAKLDRGKDAEPGKSRGLGHDVREIAQAVRTLGCRASATNRVNMNSNLGMNARKAHILENVHEPLPVNRFSK
jgi:hypothetical protein